MNGREEMPKFAITKILNKCCLTGFQDEIKELLKIAWPVSGNMVAVVCLSTVSFAFCGHVNKVLLDSVSLAVTMTNLFGYSAMYGLGTACDALFSQIHGSSNKHRLGITLQRSILALLLCCLPCAALCVCTEHILKAIGQEPINAEKAGQFSKLFSVALPAISMFVPISKYLQAQSIVLPSLVIGVIVNLLNALLLWIFLFKLSMDAWGAAAALVCSWWLVFVLHLLYVVIWKVYLSTWSGFSSECLEDWGQFFGLAVPGMVMFCVEWWSYEIVIMCTGFLGQTSLAAFTITHSLNLLFFQISFGLGIAASVRVGNHLGAGDYDAARTASRATIAISTVIAVTFCILEISLKDVLPKIYTTDSEVVTLSSQLLKLICVEFLFDGSQGAITGIIRGCGRHLFGALINVFTYYAIALPVGISLMFKSNLGVLGSIVGFTLCTACQVFVFCIRIHRTDWKLEALKAQKRAGEAKAITKPNDDTETAVSKKSLVPRSATLKILADHDANEIGIKTLTEEIETKRSHQYTSAEKGHENRSGAISYETFGFCDDGRQKTVYTSPSVKTYALRLGLTLIMVLILVAGMLLDIKLKKATANSKCCLNSSILPMNSTLDVKY